MATVRPQDILLRAGGGTLKRLQTLAAAGSGRGVEVPYTFTRAVKRAFKDRDGTLKQAAINSLALDWPSGLVDASGAAIGGPTSEGARANLITAPENFGAWGVIGTPTLTAGQADPFGGTAAYLIEDNDAGNAERLTLGLTFTGNGDKATALYVKQGTSDDFFFGVHDFTAGVWRHQVKGTWTAGVPTLSSTVGSGTLFTPEQVASGWWRVAVSIVGVVAANGHTYYLAPTQNVNADLGTTYFYGVNAWNSPWISSYPIGADSLTVPFNNGPVDCTVLIRLARPGHADASGALGVSPGIFSFGAGSAARIGAYFDPAARNIISVIDTATTDATQTTAIPAGNPTICIQYKNLTTGGQTALDVGSGLTAFSSAATAFSAFSSQTLRIGRYDDELYGVVGDMVVARGLFTRAEMLLIP